MKRKGHAWRFLGPAVCLAASACSGPTDQGAVQTKVERALQAGDTKVALIELRAYLKDQPESGRATLMLACAMQQPGVLLQ